MATSVASQLAKLRKEREALENRLTMERNGIARRLQMETDQTAKRFEEERKRQAGIRSAAGHSKRRRVNPR